MKVQDSSDKLSVNSELNLTSEILSNGSDKLHKPVDIVVSRISEEASEIPESSNIVKDHEHSLHEQLKAIDPERALQLHPNDTRKIARSLQIHESTGRKHSELLLEQKGKIGSSHLGGPLRFPRTLVFWLTCDQDVLDRRIGA